jgi:hypothetical protein
MLNIVGIGRGLDGPGASRARKKAAPATQIG